MGTAPTVYPCPILALRPGDTPSLAFGIVKEDSTHTVVSLELRTPDLLACSMGPALHHRCCRVAGQWGQHHRVAFPLDLPASSSEQGPVDGNIVPQGALSYLLRLQSQQNPRPQSSVLRT